MRSRFIGDLPIEGKEKITSVEPRLDLYGTWKVVSIFIQFGDLDSMFETELTLVAESEGDHGTYRTGFRFGGVRQIVMPEMVPLLFLHELEIEDVRDRMLEGIHFEIVAYSSGFRCSCRDVSITEFLRVQ